jgi:hypothetical protein
MRSGGSSMRPASSAADGPTVHAIMIKEDNAHQRRMLDRIRSW